MAVNNNPFTRERRFFESGVLRADHGMSYLDFIRSLERMWIDSHPGVPFVGKGTGTMPKYPCIIYALEMRKPIAVEPKQRYREELRTPSDDPAIIIKAQRFQNLISFSVLTENDVQTAEELIEVFEDFMLEYTPVLKQLGASDIFYIRRLPDGGQNRQGRDIIDRTVSYMVTCEKVVAVNESKLKEIIVDVRTWLSQPATPSFVDASATPNVDIIDQFDHATPIS